jgi:hypothetical protein
MVNLLQWPRFTPLGRYLILIPVRGWANQTIVVRLEGLGKLKIVQFYSLEMNVKPITIESQIFIFQSYSQEPQQALNLLVTEESYWALFYMPLYTFLHNLLNVLVQIANIIGLQKISKDTRLSFLVLSCTVWSLFVIVRWNSVHASVKLLYMKGLSVCPHQRRHCTLKSTIYIVADVGIFDCN